MSWDEFGLVLQDSTGPTETSWSPTIRRALLELYGASEPPASWRSKMRADTRLNHDPIEQPTLTVLGATTPESFYLGLTNNSVTSGLLNRLIVVSVDDRPKKQRVEAPPSVPAHLVADTKAARAVIPRPDSKLAAVQSDAPDAGMARMIAVPWAGDEVQDRFEALSQELDDIIEANPLMNSVIRARGREHH
jgi:hypothetical protein